MTVDAVRAGYRLGEYELDLSTEPAGARSAASCHRARQLVDFVRTRRDLQLPA